MLGTILLINLAGAVALLLWGTHMVSSGVLRGFGTVLRNWLGRHLGNRWLALLAGLGITGLLQSSTATSLMAASFTASGTLGLAPALAVMLGANVAPPWWCNCSASTPRCWRRWPCCPACCCSAWATVHAWRALASA